MELPTDCPSNSNSLSLLNRILISSTLSVLQGRWVQTHGVNNEQWPKLVVLNGMIDWFLSPRGHSAVSRDISDGHTWRSVLLASSRERPGILLDILQGTFQPPQQRIIPPQMPIMPRLRNPANQRGPNLLISDWFKRVMQIKLIKCNGSLLRYFWERFFLTLKERHSFSVEMSHFPK